MLRTLSIAALILIAACNTNTSGSGQQEGRKAGSTAPAASSWTKEDENEMLDACIENARTNLREDTAYALCKCVVQQVKARYPHPDSAANALTDPEQARTFAANCK